MMRVLSKRLVGKYVFQTALMVYEAGKPCQGRLKDLGED